MNPTTDQLLAFLLAFDVPGRATPVAAAVTFLAIADGCDNKHDIERRTGLPMRTAARLARQLSGRDRWGNGKWVESPFSLLESRPHPHRPGLQYRLSPQGQEVANRLLAPGKSD